MAKKIKVRMHKFFKEPTGFLITNELIGILEACLEAKIVIIPCGEEEFGFREIDKEKILNIVENVKLKTKVYTDDEINKVVKEYNEYMKGRVTIHGIPIDSSIWRD